MFISGGIIGLDNNYRLNIFVPKSTSMWRILLSILLQLISKIFHPQNTPFFRGKVIELDQTTEVGG